MVSDIDCAYLAGLFDGEGTIGIYYRRRNYIQSVKMSSVDIRDLRELYESFGCIGSFAVYDNKSTTNYPQARWGITKRSEIVSFLNLLLPFLRLKRSQAVLMLDYCAMCDEQISRKGVLTAWDLSLRDTFAERLKGLKAPNI